MRALLLLALFLIPGVAQAMARHEVVTLRQGALRGIQEGGTWAFKGVPYAAPPVGPLRWRAPQAPISWSGIRDARSDGNECIQPKTQTQHPRSKGSEDCLTLNLWSPNLGKAASPLPVMVFIHGGFFAIGSKNATFEGFHIYNGASLAAKGSVIVVTINYRLEAMGFLAHAALTSESGTGDSGNYGLLDQLQALHWVKDNIAAFGGDPERVTVFGESAGGASVLALSASPLGAGLFKYAIVESGYLTKPTLSEAENQGARVAHRTGCDQTADVLQCLRGLPAAQIIGSMSGSQRDGASDPFLPNVGGHVLPEPVAQAFAAGRINPESFLIGSNSNESSLLMKALYGRKVRNDAELSSVVTQSSGSDFWNLVQPLYNSSQWGSAQAALIQLSTDAIFTCPALQLLRSAVSHGHARAWRYVFTHTSHSALLKSYGAGHGLELPYVFHETPRFPILGFTRAEAALSDSIMAHWAQFATTGDPGWREFSERGGEAYQDLNLQERTQLGFRSAECKTITQ